MWIVIPEENGTKTAQKSFMIKISKCSVAIEFWIPFLEFKLLLECKYLKYIALNY